MCFWLLTFSLFGQNLISYVTLNTDEAYIGQPVRLTVSVYSSTWFTSGIDVGNIQVDGALTVYFRSLSNSRDFSGKTHAGVDFYYNVFPTQEGVITIPSLSINIESPKPGGFKGIKRTITTRPKVLTVKGIPAGYDPNNWLVSSSLNISEKWSASLSDIKVGDVVQRTIYRSAQGTLSEFLPVTKWDSITGVSIYPKRPQLNTRKSKAAVSATRSETVNYLFEKEGDIVIPPIEYVYWNYNTKKFYKKEIDSLVVSVKPNADLAMLASIKKSLQKEVVEAIQAEETPFLIFGIEPKLFFQYLISGLVILFLLFKILKRVIPYIITKYNSYLASETYAFAKVKKAIVKNDYFLFLELIPSWLNRIPDNNKSLQEMVRISGSKQLEDVLKDIDKVTFSLEKKSEAKSFKLLLKELKLMRKNHFKQQHTNHKSTIKNTKWLNPTASD